MLLEMSTVSARTVSRRLAVQGYKMSEKLTADDEGAQWRKTRIKWCQKHAKKTYAQWQQRLQGVGDFRFFVIYPQIKTKFARKNAPCTIMSKSWKKKRDFQEAFFIDSALAA